MDEEILRLHLKLDDVTVIIKDQVVSHNVALIRL